MLLVVHMLPLCAIRLRQSCFLPKTRSGRGRGAAVGLVGEVVIQALELEKWEREVILEVEHGEGSSRSAAG